MKIKSESNFSLHVKDYEIRFDELLKKLTYSNKFTIVISGGFKNLGPGVKPHVV